MKKSKRWKDTFVGEGGVRAAEALLPAVDEWLTGYCGDAQNPLDFAEIAREVVLVVARERRLFEAYNSSRVKRG